MSWHPDVTEIQALIDGELNAQARRGVEAHLQGCATCGATAARLREISEALHAIPRVKAPADLHERILCAVASAPRVVEPACAEYAEMASAYVDGELIGADRDAFEAHVFNCPKCYATLKHTEHAVELLRAIPRRRVPEELFERITAAVAAEHAAAVRFTWRRVATLGAGLAAAAAVMVALLLPDAHLFDGTMTPTPTVADHRADAPVPETMVATAPVAESAETVGAATTIAGAGPATVLQGRAPAARVTRAREEARSAGDAAVRVSPPTARDSRETRSTEASPASPPVVSDAHVPPAPPPVTAAHSTIRPRPAPTPLAPAPARMLAESTRTTDPQASPSEVASAAPSEPATAVAVAPPRTGEPESHAAGPVAIPVPPAPPAPASSRGDEPLRVAVVPRQQGARTLYRASDEPATEAIERARAAVARGRSSAFDDPRTGIVLR